MMYPKKKTDSFSKPARRDGGRDLQKKAKKHILIKKRKTDDSTLPRRDEEKKYPRERKAEHRGKSLKKRDSIKDKPKEERRDSLFPGSKAVRLNKYIANAGICSRRDADKLIESGAVKVNGKVVTELGTKINPGDVVEYGGQRLSGEPLRYVLLNKPKGYISTLEDPQNRQTVMQLIAGACRERVFPVGRLDRNTTGLLLFTNDGDLATRLTHPKHRIKKVYHAELDKPLSKNDMIKIADGLDLEDGFIAPDEIAYAEDGSDRKKIGIAIHSGKNRIVRRIFEKMNYEVIKLDRVVFANLTKKNLPRGKWRHLSQAEINILRRI